MNETTVKFNCASLARSAMTKIGLSIVFLATATSLASGSNAGPQKTLHPAMTKDSWSYGTLRNGYEFHWEGKLGSYGQGTFRLGPVGTMKDGKSLFFLSDYGGPGVYLDEAYVFATPHPASLIKFCGFQVDDQIMYSPPGASSPGILKISGFYLNGDARIYEFKAPTQLGAGKYGRITYDQLCRISSASTTVSSQVEQTATAIPTSRRISH